MEKCAFLLDCDPRWKWKDDYKGEEWMPYYFITFKIERISQIWNKVCILLLFIITSILTGSPTEISFTLKT